MTTLRFDSVGGASGNMILGALADLGIDVNAVSRLISSLDVEDFKIRTEKKSSKGFIGTLLTVEATESHHHRNLAEIKKLIEESNIPDSAKDKSIRIFTRLAEAEANVHGTTIDKIHFHEVGAMDSIIDIVGVCIALEMLEIDEIVSGPLPLGHGTTECAHGTLPVPVPATLELLKGREVVQTDEPFELVTPTGAAILSTLSNAVSGLRPKALTLEKTGTGFGSRELKSRPNMIRATILKEIPDAGSNIRHPENSCLVLETNIDDTNPELIGSLTDKLLAQGALDVFTASVQMKKQRPGILLTVLCEPDNREKMLDTIFTESTTFGVREHMTNRTCLEREFNAVETPYGTVRIKTGFWKGTKITSAPEHDDCVKCAKQQGVSIRTVYESALKAEKK